MQYMFIWLIHILKLDIYYIEIIGIILRLMSNISQYTNENSCVFYLSNLCNISLTCFSIRAFALIFSSESVLGGKEDKYQIRRESNTLLKGSLF